MAVIGYVARVELRRRWRSALLIALLVGVAGGAVLTTVAGARRSSTAYDRFRNETLASDLDVAFDGSPEGSIDGAVEAIRALPQVVASRRAEFPFLVPAGSGFYPYLDFLALAVDDSGSADVDRPRLLEGRLPDPADPTEVAIVEIYARESGLGVGDRAEFESFAPEQLEPLFTSGDAGPPAGPRFELVVTGIFDAPTFLSESSGDFTPRLFLTPAFSSLHGDAVATYSGGVALRLERGADDIDAVSRTLREMFPDAPLEITPSTEVDRKIASSIDVIVAALALCALVAALAGGVAIAQALTRHFDRQEGSDRSLAALGVTQVERGAIQAITAVPIAIVGAVIAVVVSVAASPLMPVGVARRAEPDPGVSVDGPILLLGFLGVVVGVLLIATLAALAVGRRARRARKQVGAASPSRSMRALRRTSLPPPAATGVGMALDPRAGTAWSVRSAVLGVVFGVAGLVAVMVFVAGVDGLVGSPSRYGAPFDAVVSGFSGDVLEAGGDELLADPAVARMGVGSTGLVRIAGDEVPSYAFESLKGDMNLTLLDGHAPSGGAEVVLGSSTRDAAGAGLGDEVEVQGAGGSLRATVVGIAVFPVFDERGSPGRGVLLGLEDLERISGPEEISSNVLIAWADGVDPEVANGALGERTETEVFAPRLPSEVNNLREVDALPKALAAFLAVLAALAATHALITTVRLRRQDLAVLRTLGFDRRQLGSTLAWQATTIALIGIATGVPLGLAVGRATWQAVASSIGVVADPTVSAVAVALVAVAAMVVLNVAAVAPVRSARSVSAASVLRSG